MICQSKVRVLFAMGVFVLGITTFANAGDLMEDALASIERSSPKLAGAFENIFAIPETRELAFAIEAYFQQDGSIKGKQLCPHWRDQYTSICEFLDDLNLCADWLEDQIPKVKLADMIISEFSHLSYLQLSAPLLTDGLMEPLGSRQDEISFCDDARVCQSWYYHFLSGSGKSYMRIVYTRKVEGVPGAVVFYMPEPPPVPNPPPWTHKAIPVTWESTSVG